MKNNRCDYCRRGYYFLDFCLLLTLIGVNNSHAMWINSDEVNLINSSSLIVVATYTGQATFSMSSNDTSPVTFGVLVISKIIKGNLSTKLAFIRVPNPGQIRKSDDLIYENGQTGLWFLRTDVAYPGIYLVDHPQRFVPKEQQKQKITAVKRLLHQ